MSRKNGRHLFREGDLVAHKENIGLRMEVRKVIRTKLKPRSSSEKPRVFINGIECGWWVGEEYQKEIFYTRSLVPWETCEKGHNAVVFWLQEQAEINPY